MKVVLHASSDTVDTDFVARLVDVQPDGTTYNMAEGMLRAACGRVPEHVVNREVLDRPGFRAKLARFAENREGA